MSMKNIYEVFDDFKKEKTKAGRVKVLRDNDTYALRQVLIGTFHPDIEFTVDDIPKVNHQVNLPAGMAYSNMTTALDRIYLFMKGNSRVPEGLTEKRKLEILSQILEALEVCEAEVFANILKKDQKIPYLTLALINEAFPEILPKS